MSRVSLKGALNGLDLQAPPEPAAQANGEPDAEPQTQARLTTPVDPPAERSTVQVEPTRPRQPAPQPAKRDDGPKYLALVRKEARLREDQVDELSTQARRLMRNRPTPTGERITDNTLIRIAVDLLLARTNQLAGVDEDELRKSVGL